MSYKLIADSGATKCQWCLIGGIKKKKFTTQGISPYFLNKDEIYAILQKELGNRLKDVELTSIHFYGTGLSNPDNANVIKSALKSIFGKAKIEVQNDLLAAARALCGKEKGMACILGTGSNSCFFNGKKIVKNSPGLGYVLGDEGSGAYLGRKVIQYYMYNTFDEDLRSRFDARFLTNPVEILESVYKKPMPNRYLASYAIFLAENRGHYMIENILEDGLNDFFFIHLYKYRETWTMPINFAGSVAYGFRDVLQDLCNSYELQLGTVLKNPIDGLVAFHAN